MAVLEELGSKLTDIAGIKVSFPVQNDKDFILKIYARLCLMYDEAWDFGDASFSLSCKKILRLLNRVGIAHLTPTAADVVDPRRLPRVWSAFLSHLEQKYGSQGLYPRLRKVLKQQQILAARREAERERLQRMTDSAYSPSKLRLGDISTGSALSQNSQEDVRFAKPRPPAQKIRYASASSSGSAASPSKGGIRSRIPVSTSMRVNVIPTGKQLARTPSLPAKNTVLAAAPASAGPQHMAQVFGSPRLVAPKAVALAPALGVERESPSPDRDRSDCGVSDGASSADASPARRRSLIPAPKTPEQALGEYIENRLNAGFPREARVEVEPTSPEPPIATATTPAALQSTLNVTYSAERPAAAPRAAEQPPSPAADAREAILQTAEDAVDAEDKENVRPAETETMIDEKPTADEDGCTSTACGVRRDTFEVTPTPENPGKPGDADVPSSDPVESTATDAAHGRRTKKGRSKKITEQSVKSTPAPESREAKEIGSDTTENHVDPSPVQPALKSSSVPPEEPAKKRGTRGRPEVNPDDLQCTDAADQHDTQPVALKKRGARAKKTKAVSQDLLLGAEAVTVPEIAPVENFPETAQESTSEVPETVARKKRSVRTRKAKQPSGDAPPTVTADKAAAPEGDAAAQPVPDTSVDAMGNTEASSEAQPESLEVVAEEAPKKRRGRSRKEEKVIDKTVGNVPQAAASGAVSCETVASVEHEIPHEVAESTADEAPKRRRGRGKKKEHPVAELAEDVPSQPEIAPVLEVMPSTTEISENHRDHQGYEPATATEHETIKRRLGRATKEVKQAAVVADIVSPTADPVPTPAPAASSPVEGQPQPASEPTEPVVTSAPVRASRRRTAARQQKSIDSETADTSDPDWTPGTLSVTGCRRGRRAAARQASQPTEVPEEEAAPDPDQAAVGGRTRRAQQAEPSEPPSAERSQTTEPGGGGRVGRATRGRCTTIAATTTQAERRNARGDEKTPGQEQQQAPRRRRLRVVQESDSEGGTPPAHVDALPSPAPPQRARRARKAVNDSSRPRRALRALENCD